MLLAYLLLFLLHLSASVCHATSRNHLLLLPAAAPSPSPAAMIRGHRTIAKDLSPYHVHYYPALMARRGGPPPLPSPAAVETSGAVGGARPPEKEISAAMAPSPSPWEVDSGHGEAGGGAGGGGGEGSGPSSTEAAVDGDQDDIGIDYGPPKTHPPSHN
ncbi:hypothetical protein ACP70R_003037 [Stipagrostis hirtigluma subsp. patula]